MATSGRVARAARRSGGETRRPGSKAATHCGDEIFRGYRFAQDAGDIDVIQWRVGPRNDDDRNIACVGVSGDFLLYRQTIEFWQVQIEENDVGRVLVEHVQRRQTVLRFDDVEAGKGQRASVHLPYQRIVFDYKHLLAGAHTVMIAEEFINAAPNAKPCR